MSTPHRSARLLDLVFLVGVALFLCSIAIGIYHSADTRMGFPSVYDSYLDDGDRLFALGDFGNAAEHYRVATTINREDPTAFLRLGVCLELTRQREEAKAAYENAMSLQLSNDSHFTPEHPYRKKKKKKAN